MTDKMHHCVTIAERDSRSKQCCYHFISYTDNRV